MSLKDLKFNFEDAVIRRMRRITYYVEYVCTDEDGKASDDYMDAFMHMMFKPNLAKEIRDDLSKWVDDNTTEEEQERKVRLGYGANFFIRKADCDFEVHTVEKSQWLSGDVYCDSEVWASAKDSMSKLILAMIYKENIFAPLDSVTICQYRLIVDDTMYRLV